MPIETFVSTDVETDGPLPGINSMLSFGSVALDEAGNELGTFGRNLDTLPGAHGAVETMEWWKTQPEAWAACRSNLVAPERAMQEYVSWLKSLPGRPVFVAYPVGFDFTFVYWYLMRFTGSSPFGFSALDIKTFAMALLGKGYRESSTKSMPKVWFPPETPHTHVAIEDAREQGLLFINMLREARSRLR
jgi:hypothetical protein